ncbi:MAG: Ig-like domain repeat protein [Acidobacteriota bacterium]|nr:Ig-like domain repeat protein [Acidobacteriota bacterium]
MSEIPAGGGAASTVLTGDGINYDVNNLWIDATKSNLYVTEGPYNVYKYPISNCVVQTGSQTSFSIGNLGAVSYYWSASAVAADATGDVFIGTDVSCCTPANELLEENASDSTGTTLLGNLASPIVSIAVDSGNNIYYASGGGLYELTYSSGSYSSTPVAFGSGYTSVVGVSLDAAGNLYVADQGTAGYYASNGYYPALYLASILWVIPNEGGVLNPADQYIVTEGSGAANPLTLSNAVATDQNGNLYSVSGAASVYETTRDSANLGSEAVGSTGTGTLNVVFNANATPASFTGTGAFSNAGTGSCAATSYKSSDSCTVTVSLAPTAPGLAFGALVVADASGNTLSSANLCGSGLGAGLTVDPGTVASLASGYKTPQSIARDAAGDIFIADSGANTVWEVPAGGTTPVSIGSGLSGPMGVAVDGAGNVYIADTGNSRIVEIPFVDGALSTPAQSVVVSSSTTLAGSALNSPAGISTDSQGNLYIADTGNNRIVDLPHNEAWDVASAFTIGAGFSSPLAAIPSTSGSIYIADSGNGKIYSIPFASSGAGKTVVATGYSNPSALATDAAGDLFVVDKGNTQILRIPNVSGSLVAASAQNVSFGIADPYGIAVDPAGNLYVSDDVNAAAYTVSRTNATQSLGKWNPGTTSNSAEFFVENSGNQTLTLGTPFYVATGNTADFTLLASESGACASGGSIAVGANCALEATFTPAALASYSETLALSSNATNTSAPTAIFTGIGATTAATQTTLTVTSPSGSPYYEEPIALSASVASVKASNGTPIGSVALLVDGVQTATSTLNSSGIATFSLSNGLAGGSHTLQADYEGGETAFIVYSRSDSAADTIDVRKVATTTALSFTTLYINPSSQPAGDALTLVATVSPAGAGIPTGTVTFTIKDSGGAAVTASGTLAPASGGVFQATYSYTPTAPASGVTYYVVSVSASYGGDGNFTGSSTGSQSFDVGPSTGSVGITASGTALTGSTSYGSGGTITFTNTSYGGWQGVVGYQCVASTLPANAICVFSPGQVSVQASTSGTTYPLATTKLTVLVDNPPNSPAQNSMLWWAGGLTGLLLFWARRRMMRGAWATVTMVGAALLVVAAGGLVACSSGTPYSTPAGSSTVTVVATSDPYTSGSNQTTQPCASSTTAPCSQQTFQVSLTVH